MMLWRKKKLFFIVLTAVLGLIILMVLLRGEKQDVPTLFLEGSEYEAEDAIKNNLEMLQTSEDMAQLLQPVNTVEKVTTLVFEGMVDRETTRELLELLEIYQVKAVFFLPGIKSAEDPETVRLIEAAGQEIGSYTLSAMKGMETLTLEEMVEDFSRTNVILEEITGETPVLLKCNVTKYSEDLLRAAYASGLEEVVDSQHYLNYQSFSTKDHAVEYVKGLDRGSIITIKTDSVLDETEYEVQDVHDESTPAEDPMPSVEVEEEELSPEDKLITGVKYLLEALQENKYTLVSARQLGDYADADFLLDFEEQRLENQGQLAFVYSHIQTSYDGLTYTFADISNEENLEKVLKILEEQGITATFFVTGEEVLQYEERIREIINAGHQIGNGGLTGQSLINKSFEEIAFEIYKCDQLLQDRFKIDTAFFMPPLGQYDAEVREAVSALNYRLVTYNKHPILTTNQTMDEIMAYFAGGFNSGDIIHLGLSVYQEMGELLTEINKKVQGLGMGITELNQLFAHPYVVVTEEAVFDSIEIETPVEKEETVDLAPSNYVEKRTLNAGKEATVVRNLYTTQPSVVYTFSGISDAATLEQVLLVLDQLDAKGTFFVTGKEIINSKELIDEIVSRGHQLGNGGYGFNVSNPSIMTFDALCYEIEMGERYLRAYLGDAYDEVINKYYMPRYADAKGQVLEAAATLGYSEVITYNKSMMTNSYKEKSAEYIIDTYFANTVTLHRGDIVYFRLDYLTEENAIQEIVYETASRYIKNVPYDITTIDDMSTNELVYVPTTRENAIGGDRIKATYHLPETLLEQYFAERYIGNPYMRTSQELFGFTDEEVEQLDITGKIDTEDKKVIFLTFDDWGYDDNITDLLNVLKKHKVEATFFVRVGNANMSYEEEFINPNLLRAIALDGHDIGSHTFSHMTVNIKTLEEKKKLQEELVTAHQEMARYIGDTGNLRLYFRPPELAISKLGLETLFDAGYEYVLNGDFSTHDYEAKSADELINKLINGIYVGELPEELAKANDSEDRLRISAGSVVVMHMSDNSSYTAEALDEVIPYYLEHGYQFAKLSDYLE